MYVKILYHDDKGVDLIVMEWNSEREAAKCERLLRNDLGIGYEVAFVPGDDPVDVHVIVDSKVQARAVENADKSVIFSPFAEPGLDRYMPKCM
jgi:hypothetical protein